MANDSNSGLEILSGFFREESKHVKEIFQAPPEPEVVFSYGQAENNYRPLQMPSAETAGEAEFKAFWKKLRSFFRTGAKGGLISAEAASELQSAFLAEMEEKNLSQPRYPVWLAGEEEFELGKSRFGILTMSELLAQVLQQIFPANEQAKILKDNQVRLEYQLRQSLEHAGQLCEFRPALIAATKKLVKQLDLPAPNADAFRQNLAELTNHLPTGGWLLGYRADAPLFIFRSAWQVSHGRLRKDFENRVAALIGGLRDILAVQEDNSQHAKNPDWLHQTFDFADNFINFKELASVMPSDGSEAMSAERLGRLTKVLQTLERSSAELFQRDIVWIITESEQGQASTLQRIFQKGEIRVVPQAKLSMMASGIFDEAMNGLARIFAALRIAELEVQNKYTPELHDDYFEHFDWRHMSDAELLLCPLVAIYERPEVLRQEELRDFSQMLASYRPIKIFAEKSLDAQKYPVEIEPATGELLFQPDLGAIAVAHRNCFVLQSSAALSPTVMFSGISAGLTNNLPSLFHLLTPAEGSSGVQMGIAAVVGRIFPNFVYDSKKSSRWGSRFDISDNPAPESEWPVHELEFETTAGGATPMQVAFTVADVASDEPRFAGEFQVVPPQFWSDDLLPFADYLQLPQSDAYSKVPFIWMVDADRRLHKVALSWRMVLLTRERQEFWDFLQESAGIHNVHVENAVQHLREELSAKHQTELDQLEKRALRRVEEAKTVAGKQAMEQLAGYLLDLEALPASTAGQLPTTFVEKSPSAPATSSVQPTSAATESNPVEQKSAPKEDIEAWIETALCTTCNECTQLNKNIFKYNADKQAYVANPRGGPFADIVKAAENCPAAIIHPGTPQNPNEENLEEWIKRAKPFN
jgi:ferredoxin